MCYAWTGVTMILVGKTSTIQPATSAEPRPRSLDPRVGHAPAPTWSCIDNIPQQLMYPPYVAPITVEMDSCFYFDNAQLE